MRCECVENRTHRRTHGQTKTQASTQTHIRGRLTEGPAPSSVVPVAGDLGHTAASSARHTAAKRRGGWGYGNRERLTGDKYIFFREEEKCDRYRKQKEVILMINNEIIILILSYFKDCARGFY